MGKKQPAEMAKQKSRFIEGAKERGVSENLAAHIFDLVEEFAGYGFNKSHAAAYAVDRVSDRVPEGALSRSISSPPR